MRAPRLGMTAGCFEQAGSRAGVTVIYTGPFDPWAAVRATPLSGLLAKDQESP
jgi:hypothetical protein